MVIVSHDTGFVRDLAPDRVLLMPEGEGRIVSDDGGVDVTVAEAAGDRSFEATAVHKHRLTEPLDGDGQGDADVSYAFAAHRAVVDVDIDLSSIPFGEGFPFTLG